MRRRMGRPGLVGTMARTAVIAGTATAVTGSVERRQAARQQSRDEQAAGQQSGAEVTETQAQLAALGGQQATMPAPEGAGSDLTSQLKQLADLKTAGVLDDSEFAATKAKLLAS